MRCHFSTQRRLSHGQTERTHSSRREHRPVAGSSASSTSGGRTCESFPQFIEGVEEVRRLDSGELYWKADILGVERGMARANHRAEPVPAHRKETIERARNGGAVEFREVGPNATKVRLTLEFEPEGAGEKIGGLLGLIYTRVTGDLLRFKEHMEQAHTGTK